jgi:hypothetical protein
MLNYQIKTQNIAYFTTFLPINRQLSSCGHKKRDLPNNGQIPKHYAGEMIIPQQQPVQQPDVRWARGMVSRIRS